MAKRLSYFMRAEGSDRDAVKRAIEWLLQVAPRKGYIAVPGLKNLDGDIGEELGRPAVMDLKLKGVTTIMGKEIWIITKLKPVHNADNSPVLAFYPYGKFLDAIDSIHDVFALLIVPWSMQEIGSWVETRESKELGARKSSKKHKLSLGKAVENALMDLIGKVNVSTGIEDPRDRDAAVQAFVILKEGGEKYSPDEIKSWLVSHGGWKAAHASEVSELANEVLAGKRSLQGVSVWPDNVIQMWRSRTNAS